MFKESTAVLDVMAVEQCYVQVEKCGGTRHSALGSVCRATLLKLEEDYIKEICAEIIKHKPDVVITEKGLSDLAMHFLTKAGISAIRRLRKTDNNRISRACGATIVHRAEGRRSSAVWLQATCCKRWLITVLHDGSCSC